MECDGSNVLELLYISTKYEVCLLTERCETFLKEDMDAGNVCTILNHANTFHLSDLMKKALSFIECSASDVFENSDFLNLTRDSLLKLLSRDQIAATECDIIKSVIRWAEEQCSDQGLEKSGPHIRTILGEILYKLRIPTLTKEEFSETVAKTEILSDHEEEDFHCYFSEGRKSETISQFPDSMRKRIPNTRVKRVVPTTGIRRFSPIDISNYIRISPDPDTRSLFQRHYEPQSRNSRALFGLCVAFDSINIRGPVINK